MKSSQIQLLVRQVSPRLGFVTSGKTLSWKHSLSRHIHAIYIILGCLADWCLYYFSSQWDVDSLQGSRERTTEQSLNEQERKKTDKRNCACKVHWCMWKCLVFSLNSPVWQAPPSHPSGQLQIPGATQIPPFLQPWGQIAARGQTERDILILRKRKSIYQHL